MLKIFLKGCCVQARVEYKPYSNYLIFNILVDCGKYEVIFTIKDLINVGTANERSAFYVKMIK